MADSLGHEDILQFWEPLRLDYFKPEKRAVAWSHYYGSEVYRDKLNHRFSMELDLLSGKLYRNPQELFCAESQRSVAPGTISQATYPAYPGKRFLDEFTKCPNERFITEPSLRQCLQAVLSERHIPSLTADSSVVQFEESTANTHCRKLLNAQIADVGKALTVFELACHELTECDASPGECFFFAAQKSLKDFASTLRKTAIARDIKTNGERMKQLETLRQCVMSACDAHHCDVDLDLWHKMQALSLTAASIKEGRDLQHCHSYQDVLWSWEPIFNLAEPDYASRLTEDLHETGMWCIFSVDREDRPPERTNIQKYLDGENRLAPFQYCDMSESHHRHSSRFPTTALIRYQS